MTSSRSASATSANRMLLVGGIAFVAILAVVFWPRGSATPHEFVLVPPSSVTTVAEGGPAAVGTNVFGAGEVDVCLMRGAGTCHR